MRRWSPALALAFLVGGTAFADVHPGPEGAKGTPIASAGSDTKGKPPEETIDQILERNAPPPSDQPPEKAAPTAPAPPADKAGAPTKAAAKPEGPPPAPLTDDNDTTAEAARPKALEAVKPTARPRVPGPYELGELDCRMLDGAGIERVLPKKIVAGEEPDLLCRVMVTQPATVATASHSLTLTVVVGSKPTYQQQRAVRVSSVGRRSLVFVIPADRISSEDTAKVSLRAQLSSPAKPPSRELGFVVEPAD